MVKSKLVKGKTYTCIDSKSCGYKVGQEYIPYLNDKGVLVLKASDGFEDPVDKLVSQFREVRD